MRRPLAVVALVAAWSMVTAFPSMGADNGTVNATVSTPSPCLTLSQTAVDFGTYPFRAIGSSTDAASTKAVTVTDCSGVDQDLLVTGSNAVSTTTAATWSLTDVTDTCTPGPNNFRVRATLPLPGSTQDILPSVSRGIGTLLGGSAPTVTLNLRMPCEGSDGQGETMAFDINFMVTIP